MEQLAPSMHESKVKKRMGALTLGDWMRRVQALGPGTRERISLPEGGDDEQ